MVHLIPRFYDATEGEVFIDGKEVSSYPLRELRKKVGIVMQKAVLFQGTIRKNLLWGKEDATEEELKEALEIAQAMEIVEKKEHGLEEEVTQGGKNFSGGQKQRLTIARALVKKPRILILDDSSSALDYATDRRLREAIQQQKISDVVFLVSQRTSSIRHADKILVLEEGELVGMGTHETLLETCEIYQEIHKSQESGEFTNFISKQENTNKKENKQRNESGKKKVSEQRNETLKKKVSEQNKKKDQEEGGISGE